MLSYLSLTALDLTTIYSLHWSVLPSSLRVQKSSAVSLLLVKDKLDVSLPTDPVSHLSLSLSTLSLAQDS